MTIDWARVPVYGLVASVSDDSEEENEEAQLEEEEEDDERECEA